MIIILAMTNMCVNKGLTCVRGIAIICSMFIRITIRVRFTFHSFHIQAPTKKKENFGFRSSQGIVIALFVYKGFNFIYVY